MIYSIIYSSSSSLLQIVVWVLKYFCPRNSYRKKDDNGVQNKTQLSFTCRVSNLILHILDLVEDGVGQRQYPKYIKYWTYTF